MLTVNVPLLLVNAGALLPAELPAPQFTLFELRLKVTLPDVLRMAPVPY